MIMLFALYSNKFYTVFNDTCTRSAARYWNDAKHFLIAFSRSWNRFYLKSFKEPYIYGVHTKGGCGGGVLKLVLCLHILLFLNNRPIVHFADGGQVGGSQNDHFLWMS